MTAEAKDSIALFSVAIDPAAYFLPDCDSRTKTFCEMSLPARVHRQARSY